MIRIAITGGEGLLGQHLRLFLLPYEDSGDTEVILIGREDWDDPERLQQKVSGVDVIVHFAGMNRGGEDEIYATNIRLVDDLLHACDAARIAPHLVFPSSTHELRDSAYGRSKKDGAARVESWAAAHAARASVLVLPHVFGEFAKPFHNSGIATMCHQLAEGESSDINPAGVFELIHARDVAETIWKRVSAGTGGRERIEGVAITVPDAYAKLADFATAYRRGEFPSLRPGLETQLFTMLHSYMAWKLLPHVLSVRFDARGMLFEVVRGSGEHQVFFSLTNPGAVRGNHYHTRKMERFCVVEGDAEIRLRHVLTGELHTFVVSGSKPVAVDMPTYWAHSITNMGSRPLLTAFWTSEQYDPDDADTFPAET